MVNDRNAELQRALAIKNAHIEFRRQVEGYIPDYPPGHRVRQALEPCVSTLEEVLDEEIEQLMPPGSARD